MEELKKRFGQDYSRLSLMSIVEEGAVKVLKKTPRYTPHSLSSSSSFLF